MGRLMGLGCIYIFFLAALFSYVTDDFSNLGKYAYQIFVVAQVVEAILTYLQFIRKYIVLNVFCMPVLKLGGWYVSWCEERGVDITSDLELIRPLPGLLSFSYSRPQDDEVLASKPVLEHWKVLELAKGKDANGKGESKDAQEDNGVGDSITELLGA
jgi:hypothetical protein